MEAVYTRPTSSPRFRLWSDGVGICSPYTQLQSFQPKLWQKAHVLPMGTPPSPASRGNQVALCNPASSDAEVRRALQGNTCPELLYSAPVNCAVLRRSFRALTPVSGECRFLLNLHILMAIGAPLGPLCLSEIEVETNTKFTGKRRIIAMWMCG